MKKSEQSLSNKDLARLERDTFKYFTHEMNPENGLVPDNTRQDAPSSIAAVGFALTAYPVGVERKYLTRADAVKRSLITLRFFHDAPQGKGSDAIGYKGFYYHFLNMKTGQREWKSELSTIDTTYLLAGALTAAMYFDRETREAEPGAHGYSWMETGARIYQIPLDRVQRGTDSVYSWPRLTDFSTSR
jgi:hypothetical protein